MISVMRESSPELDQKLYAGIQEAYKEMYAFGKASPLEQIQLNDFTGKIFIKREDMNPAHSYKWRGAFNRIRIMSSEERSRGVIAASAGNHAQGIALAAKHFKIKATIFMPINALELKKRDTQALGGDWVEIKLVGENFQEATQAARKAAAEEAKVFVHAYDDLYVMAGQGTIGEELNGAPEGPFDAIFIQVGGGGISAGISCAVKKKFPQTQIIGVECQGQASMHAAFLEHKPVQLEKVDLFCDGTSMSRAGDLTVPFCEHYLNDLITVTNEDVCSAIQVLWERNRCILEPSGALGFAGLLMNLDAWQGKKVACIATGSNVDFARLPWIVQHSQLYKA